MSSKPYKGFRPEWQEKRAAEGTFRSVMKWGDPDFFKIPKEAMYNMIKREFDLTDDDFKKPIDLGLETANIDAPIRLKKEQVAKFEEIVGAENVKKDAFTRLTVAYGKTMYDILRLRKGIAENLPDLVIYPDTTEEIEKIVAFCNEEGIPIYVFGGGSSVTRGVECIKGGISLDLRPRFNKVVKFNEINQTITVQAGMSGPQFEKILNEAKERFGAKYAYTCGHFPQSFEFSTVGGWAVTRGAGQNSTYFGKIEHIVLGQVYVTPAGKIVADDYPAKATGPDINQIMLGSEGCYGILTDVTLKIFRKMPENQFRFSFMFKDWDSAMKAGREIMQAQAGFPSVFRLSDPEETEVMMQMYNLDEMPFVGKLLQMKGYLPRQKCLLLGFTDGEKGFCKNVYKKVKQISKKFGGMSLTGIPTKTWEKGRFNDPYLRDTLQDFGIMIDTLECAVNWDNMAHVHKVCRDYVKSRPKTICMVHLSHAYPQGANLYFIFIAKLSDMNEFLEFHKGLLDHIQKSGAAMSHHHGIGKLFAPWLEGQIGTAQMDIFKALKKHFDPNNILNPGGTLGLDLEEEEKRFIRKKW